MSKVEPVKRELRRRTVGMRLRVDLWRAAEALAESENRSVSNVLEILIERGLRAEQAAA